MSLAPIYDPDRMWVDTTGEELVHDWLLSTPERFSLVIEDLLSLPAGRPVIAEGYGFLPELVAPLLTDLHQAIWLISTPQFKEASYARRGKGRFAYTRDPSRARANHIDRDLRLADHICNQALALQVATLDIDGHLSLADVCADVQQHFAPHLVQPPSGM